MIFRPTPIADAYLLEREALVDDRGYFARSFCAAEFQRHGLDPHVEQVSVSFNARAGTLRGLHRQGEPHVETKIVRCTRGAIWDVVADPRPSSPTFGLWWGTNLSAENGAAVYLGAGLLHGFVTLNDESEVEYMISVAYSAASAEGVRWDDPTLAIDWPRDPTVISDRDRELPLLDQRTN
jgi:dTDP-4-dehydrorhamnose 3,5-epimerase